MYSNIQKYLNSRSKNSIIYTLILLIITDSTYVCVYAILVYTNSLIYPCLLINGDPDLASEVVGDFLGGTLR